MPILRSPKALFVFALLATLVFWCALKQGDLSVDGLRDATNADKDGELADKGQETSSSVLEAAIAALEPERSKGIDSEVRWLEPYVSETHLKSVYYGANGAIRNAVRIVSIGSNNRRARIEEKYQFDERLNAYTIGSYVAMVADELLIQTSDLIDQSDLEYLARSIGVEWVREPLSDGLFVVELPENDGFDLLPEIAELFASARGIVEFVEPNYLVRSALEPPSDPLFIEQWSLDFEKFFNGEADINALDGWDVQRDASDVIVAVIDSGIDLNHADLMENLWINTDEKVDGLDNDGNGYTDDIYGVDARDEQNDISDVDGHGTAMSGVIGAVGGNGVGISGVAWKTQIMRLKFMDDQGVGDTADAIVCIQYAIDNGADIINASWGGEGFSRALQNAISDAGDQGILFVTAAGNEGIDIDVRPRYPASLDNSNILTVASTDRRSLLTGFSNWGERSVDIAAPGFDIVTTSANSSSGYHFVSGTSISAAIVSGMAVLVKASQGSLQPEEIKERIMASSRERSDFIRRTVSGGLADLNRALRNETNAPGHDDFLNRRPLPTAGLTERSSLTYATFEEGEPEESAYTDPKSVWYRYYSLDTDSIGVYIDPDFGAATVTVFKGADFFSLVRIARGRAEKDEKVFTFDTEVGEEYAIQVTGDPPVGGFEIGLFLPPENDAFLNAFPLVGGAFFETAVNVYASLEPGEELLSDPAQGRTLWWSYKAPESGSFVISSIGSRLDTLLGVYSGKYFSELELLAFNDNFSGSTVFSQVTVDLVEGQTYYIVVDGKGVAGGSIELSGQYARQPEFTLLPRNAFAALGERVVFTSKAIGPPPLQYQWFNGGVPVFGAQESELKIEGVRDGDYGTYFVVVNSPLGSIRSPDVLLGKFGRPPEIVIQPDFKDATEGEDVEIGVLASGSGSLTYQWYHNAIPLSGAVQASYQISGARISDSGFYHVMVSNDHGQIESATVRVTVYSEGKKPRFSIRSDTGSERFTRQIVRYKDQFVAMGDFGKVSTSTDGYLWTSRLGNSEERTVWAAVAGENAIVGRGYDAKLIVTADLNTWTVVTPDPEEDNHLYDPVYQNGVFVVLTASGKLFSSSNGLDWTHRHTFDLRENMMALAAANGRFLAASSIQSTSGYHMEFAFSQDGLEWTRATRNDLGNLEFLNGAVDRFVLGTHRAWVSEEGMDWVQLDQNPGRIFEIEKIDDYYYGISGNGRGSLQRSKNLDLDEWETVARSDTDYLSYAYSDGTFVVGPIDGSNIPFHDPENIQFPGYGGEKTGYRSFFGMDFIDGEFVAWDGDFVYQSKTGSQWKLRQLQVRGNEYPTIYGIVEGNGVFHIGDAMGPTLDQLQPIKRDVGEYAWVKAYGEGLFVAIENEYRILTSTNGVDWIAIETGLSERLRELIYAGSRFVGVGEGGRIVVSEDGVTWAEQIVGANVRELNDVVYSGNEYVASSLNGELYRSIDGFNWSRVPVDFSSMLEVDELYFNNLEFGDGKFVILANGHVLESNDLANWEFESYFGVSIEHLTYGNGVFVGVGTADDIYVYGSPKNLTPSVNIELPPNNYIQAGERVAFDINVYGENDSGRKMEVFVDGELVAENLYELERFEWQFDKVGFYDVVVKVTDSSGLVSRDGVRYIVSKKESVDVLNAGRLGDAIDVVEFKGSVYVLSSSTKVYRSDNLVDWHLAFIPTIPGSRAFYKTSSALFLAGDNGVFSTRDGIRWDFSELDLNYSHVEIASGGNWVVVSNSDQENPFLRSSDGVKWEPLSWEFADDPDDFLGELNGSLVVKGDKGFLRVMDGIGNYQLIPGPYEGTPRHGVSADGVFTLVYYVGEYERGRRFFETSDLKEWTEIASIEGAQGIGDFKRVGSLYFFEDGYRGAWLGFVGMNSWIGVPFQDPIAHLVFFDEAYLVQTRSGLYRSKDGLSWIQIGNSTNASVGMLAVENGLVTWGDGYDNLSTSFDGIDWLRITEKDYRLDYFLDMAYGSAGFVAVGSDTIAYSNDGDWSRVAKPVGLMGPIAFGNGVYVAAASEGRVAIASDGLNWEYVEVGEMGGSWLEALEFLAGPNLFAWVTGSGLYATSEDGRNWSTRLVGSGRVSELRRQGDRLYLTSDEDHLVYGSSDGLSWRTLPEPIRYSSFIVHNRGVYLGLTQNYQEPLFRSLDGFSWVKVSGALDQTIAYLRPHKQGFLAFYEQEGGLVSYYSGDGLSWERTSNTILGDRYEIVDGDIYFIGESIQRVSDVDLGLESIAVTAGEHAVGDSIEGVAKIRNHSAEALTLEGVALHARLTFGNEWRDRAGVPLAPTILGNEVIGGGESALIPFEMTVPKGVFPGVYALQCWLNPELSIVETSVSNNFAWSESLGISIPGYEVRISDSQGGQVLVEPGKSRYAKGETISLFPRADLGYGFRSWIGIEDVTDQEVRLTINRDREIGAVFERQNAINVNIIGKGEVNYSPKKGYVAPSESATFVAVPDEDWVFIRWLGDTGVVSERELRVQSDSDISVTAVFGHSFDRWSEGVFSEEELADTLVSAPDSDADGDGSTNLEEYLFGSDIRDSGSNPELRTIKRNGQVYLFYNRRMTTAGYDVSLVWSKDMVEWTKMEARTVKRSNDIETLESKLPIGNARKAFARIAVEPIETH